MPENETMDYGNGYIVEAARAPGWQRARFRKSQKAWRNSSMWLWSYAAGLPAPDLK